MSSSVLTKIHTTAFACIKSLVQSCLWTTTIRPSHTGSTEFVCVLTSIFSVLLAFIKTKKKQRQFNRSALLPPSPHTTSTTTNKLFREREAVLTLGVWGGVVGGHSCLYSSWYVLFRIKWAESRNTKVSKSPPFSHLSLLIYLFLPAGLRSVSDSPPLLSVPSRKEEDKLKIPSADSGLAVIDAETHTHTLPAAGRRWLDYLADIGSVFPVSADLSSVWSSRLILIHHDVWSADVMMPSVFSCSSVF